MTTVVSDAATTSSNPTLAEAITSARALRDAVQSIFLLTTDFLERAETAATDAALAQARVQQVLGSVAGGELTAFTSTFLLSNDAADARENLELPREVSDIVVLQDGVISADILPASATRQTFQGIASQAAMLALNAQPGDVAIRTDTSQTFALTALPASTLSNWALYLSPTGAIASVAGLTGTITSPALKAALAIAVADITDASANGRSLIAAATYAAMKALLAITAADITNASANGRSLITAADYTAMKGLLAISASDISGTAAFARLDTEDQVLTGGTRVTSKDIGAISSGTKTLDPGDRPLQHYSNTGAHSLAPGANGGSILLDITNGSGAGAITPSGFTKVAGDAFTTTVGHKFRCHVSIGSAGSLLTVQAMQ